MSANTSANILQTFVNYRTRVDNVFAQGQSCSTQAPLENIITINYKIYAELDLKCLRHGSGNLSNTVNGGVAKEYKGQLLWSCELIEISARRFNKERIDREQLFWMEISMLSTLKHKNLVSLVGFCDDNDEKIIIYRRETRGMLFGSRVLLNDDWEPKLCDFEFSMKIKASQRHHSFHTNRVEYITGYGDPTYIETKSVNHKSDIGIVLFELLCGRTSIIVNDQDNKYLVPVALFHHREKTLNDIVDPNLWKQMDPQSFNIFVEAAHDCLKEERSQRPSIDEIVPRLEKALELQLERQNASKEHTIVAADTASTHQRGKSLEHLKIGLTDIELATE
ncbi:kinase-like domain, phloem protein 2-like protein, partial [Tanacetum coccineum]